MSNHFDILVRMHAERDYTDAALKTCLSAFYGDVRVFDDGQLPSIRQWLASLSEYVREIRGRFARLFNKHHNRRGLRGDRD